MDKLDYKNLYALQDKVLDVIFSTERIFYLTGGTCLSRFYQAKRYSDDLDFFTNQNANFNRVLREIKFLLQKKFLVKEEVSSKDFIRLKINNLLQIDFINDRVYRYKNSVYLENNYVIDSWENILANKLTAIIGRDSAKDIFDIYLISKFYNFNWKEMLLIAHEKAVFYDDDLIVRLKSFPEWLMKSINLIDKDFLLNFEKEFETIIEEINQQTNHKTN